MLTPNEHREQIFLLERTLSYLRGNEPPKCCANCDQMKDGRCLTYGVIAPEHQRTPGCPDWIEVIPF